MIVVVVAGSAVRHHRCVLRNSSAKVHLSSGEPCHSLHEQADQLFFTARQCAHLQATERAVRVLPPVSVQFLLRLSRVWPLSFCVCCRTCHPRFGKICKDDKHCLVEALMAWTLFLWGGAGGYRPTAVRIVKGRRVSAAHSKIASFLVNTLLHCCICAGSAPADLWAQEPL